MQFLKVICFQRCKLKDSDATYLAGLITQNTNIEVLNVSDNRLENVGLQILLNAVFAH